MNFDLNISLLQVKLLLGGLMSLALLGVIFDVELLVFSPVILLFVALCFIDVRIPFLLLFFCIPLSWEQELGGGFGTDLPTEPLMVFLMGMTLLLLLLKAKTITSRIFLHPITLLILTHYGWMWAATIFSENVYVSMKFCLAKTWYISVFFLLPILLLRNRLITRSLLQLTLLPLVVATVIILIRHSAKDFSFESANFVVYPFFRNHVTSAALMSTMVPFTVFLWLTSKNFIMKLGYACAFVLLLTGAYFSYTRAAHLSLLLSLAIIPVVRWRMMKPVLLIVLIGLVVFVASILNDNKYLRLAPDYETTISHSSFEDLVSATYAGKDISTMERLYRWVAGYRMVVEKPWIGFGPGNFYNYYASYTLTLFRTYVSDNPEKSGIHCYYLMILTEQGFIGLSIFFVLIGFVLIYMENLYHRLTDRYDRLFFMATIMTFIIILLFQLINDLIETDKMGPFFFLCMAITVLLDLKSRGISVVHNGKGASRAIQGTADGQENKT